MRHVLYTFVLGLVVGCADREVQEVIPIPSNVDVKSIPAIINRDVDILFVIDNSESMADEQTALAANFPRFIDVLDNIQGGLPNIHIGVVTTNMGSFGQLSGVHCDGGGDGGSLQTGGFAFTGGVRYIEDIEGVTPGTRVTNYGATALPDVFRQIATVGILGCPFEQPLASMRAALSGNPDNAGFLRPGAHLAVVVISDEDDCSTDSAEFFGPASARLGPIDSFRCFEFGITCDEPDPRVPGPRTNCRSNETSPYQVAVAEYVQFLQELRPGNRPGNYDAVVAAIIGDRDPVAIGTRDAGSEIRPTLNPSCTYPPSQSADPAVRLGTFLDGFPLQNSNNTICTDDLSNAVESVAELIRGSIGYRCFDSPLVDVHPETPEPDYECAVAMDYASQPDAIIPQCDATASVQPCWRISATLPDCTTSATGLGIEVVTPPGFAPPTGTLVDASCLVQ